MTRKNSTAAHSDAQLVERSLTGDRDAFARIVERYQSLVCSITYNATGSLSMSEDLAQETFFAAWKQLSTLREPSLLRSWLCGITRFLVGKELRRRGHEPVHAAQALDAIPDAASPEPSPAAQAVSREEEAILWRALERIPEIYREPLILFYREQESVERVAAALELSEDAVKQRLSRGRKLLHEEVIGFVEGTLSRSAPDQAFSDTVLAMLPAAPVATAGAGIASKGASAAKSGLLGSLLLPFVGIAGGIMANVLIARSAATARERRALRSAFAVLWAFVLGWCVGGQFTVQVLRRHWEWSDQTNYAVMVGFWWFSAMALATWIIVMFRRFKAIFRHSGDEAGVPPAARAPLKLGIRIAVVTGLYLSCFSWMIMLAWRAHDHLSLGIIGGTMAVLGVRHFLQLGTGTMRSIRHMALAFGIILVILNCRLDVWLAASRGTDLADIHRLMPLWVVPSATATLLIWAGIVWAATRPQKPA